jgi:hypothetical protein
MHPVLIGFGSLFIARWLMGERAFRSALRWCLLTLLLMALASLLAWPT